jgi:hypothetical protein
MPETKTNPAAVKTHETIELLLASLDELAKAFDHEATHYDSLDDAEPVLKAVASLRLIRTGLREGIFEWLEGYAWLRAGRTVLKATIYARENNVNFYTAAQAVSA